MSTLLVRVTTVAVIASLAIATKAQAVVVAHSDEETVDLVLLPDGQSADLTVTENVPVSVANTRRDQLNHGATEQTAEQWQLWSEKNPIVYTWTATDAFLGVAVPRIMQSANVQRVSVRVYFIVPDADNPQQAHLFESFDCGSDCMSGNLPSRPTFSPWAVAAIRDEAHKVTGK